MQTDLVKKIHIVENFGVKMSLRHDSVKAPVPFICYSHSLSLCHASSACLKLAALIVIE